MAGQYLQDWWFYPIEIIEGVNDTLVISVNFSPGTVTFAPGLYYWWVNWFVDFDVPGTFNFETELPNLFNAAAGWIPVNEEGSLLEPPVRSPKLLTKGRNFAPYQAGPDATLVFSDNASTVDPRWFGFDGSYDPTTTTTKLVSDYGLKGIWKPTSVNPAIFASDKRSNPHRDIVWSTQRARGRRVNDWYEQRIRRFYYQNIRAGNIYGDRCLGPGYAHYAGVGQGDTGNGFDGVWRALSSGHPVYVVHDMPTLPPQGLVEVPDIGTGEESSAFLNGRIERVTLANSNAAQTPGASLTTARLEGEVYDLALNVIVEPVDGLEVYPQ